MTTRVVLLRETNLARQYRFADGTIAWIPRSVVKSTVKFPASANPLDSLVDKPLQEIHEINVDDWWWRKNFEDDDDGDQKRFRRGHF